MNTDVMLIVTTCPDEAVAAGLGTALLERRQAACVSRLPGLHSSYHWEGRMTEDTEVLVLIKAPADRYAEIEASIRELHPYDVPEIIGLPVTAGLPDYLAWVVAETAP